MAGNMNNLVKAEDLTPEQRRKNASKAGKASAKAKKERKTLKEQLLLLLSEGDTQENITISLLSRAMTGDVRAFEVIRDTIGEKPTDKVESDNTTKIQIDLGGAGELAK